MNSHLETCITSQRIHKQKVQNFIFPPTKSTFSWRGICTFQICRFHWYFTSFVISGGLKNQCKQGRSPQECLITKWELGLPARHLWASIPRKTKPALVKASHYCLSFSFPKFQGASVGGVWVLCIPHCSWGGLRFYSVGWDPHWALHTQNIYLHWSPASAEPGNVSFSAELFQILLHAAALCNCRFCFCPSALSNNLLTIRAFLKGKCCYCSHFLPFPVRFIEQQKLWVQRG